MEKGIVLYLGNILMSKASLGWILGNNHIPGQFTTKCVISFWEKSIATLSVNGKSI